MALIGPDKELFLQGRRAESQGLGIGAFAYYSRVIENQKGRLVGEIKKVSEKLGAKPALIQKLGSALREARFSSVVDQTKDAIPDALLIEGHSPLLLLQRALSEGQKAEDDEQGLSLAQSIRIVLTEFAERASRALQDQAEVKAAVSRLMNPTRVPAKQETVS